jgi:hypothetical protein
MEYLYLSLHNIRPLQEHNFLIDLCYMFAGLKPLRYLRVRCPRDTAIIHEIFSHHGRTLRGFIIEPYMPHGQRAHQRHPLYLLFNASDLVNLSRQAPYLKNSVSHSDVLWITRQNANCMKRLAIFLHFIVLF